MAETEARIKDDPSFRPLAEWRKDFEDLLGRLRATGKIGQPYATNTQLNSTR